MGVVVVRVFGRREVVLALDFDPLLGAMVDT